MPRATNGRKSNGKKTGDVIESFKACQDPNHCTCAIWCVCGDSAWAISSTLGPRRTPPCSWTDTKLVCKLLRTLLNKRAEGQDNNIEHMWRGGLRASASCRMRVPPPPPAARPTRPPTTLWRRRRCCGTRPEPRIRGRLAARARAAKRQSAQQVSGDRPALRWARCHGHGPLPEEAPKATTSPRAASTQRPSLTPFSANATGIALPASPPTRGLPPNRHLHFITDAVHHAWTAADTPAATPKAHWVSDVWALPCISEPHMAVYTPPPSHSGAMPHPRPHRTCVTLAHLHLHYQDTSCCVGSQAHATHRQRHRVRPAAGQPTWVSRFVLNSVQALRTRPFALSRTPSGACNDLAKRGGRANEDVRESTP